MAAAPMLDITALILSDRDDDNVRHAIAAIAPHVARTIAIGPAFGADVRALAKGCGAVLSLHPHPGPERQLRAVLAGLDDGWILCLQSDEYLPADTIARLHRLLAAAQDYTGQNFTGGLHFARSIRASGRALRWGGTKNAVCLRLWRAALPVRLDTDSNGAIAVTLAPASDAAPRIHAAGRLICESRETLTQWTARMNRRATTQVLAWMEDPGAARREATFRRAPAQWVTRYVGRLGLVDGRRGLVWHFLCNFWMPLLTQVKLFEARAAMRGGSPAHWIAETEARHDFIAAPANERAG